LSADGSTGQIVVGDFQRTGLRQNWDYRSEAQQEDDGNRSRSTISHVLLVSLKTRLISKQALNAQRKEMLEDKDQKIARPRQIYLGAEKRDFVPIKKR